MSLIVLGTVAIDNVKTQDGQLSNMLGGSGSHFAMSARHFTKVHLASVIGQDFPQEHVKMLKKKGIDTTSLVDMDGKTFRWDGEYKKEDLNHAITHGTELGVLLTYNPQVSVEQRKIPNVFLGNFDPEIQMKFYQLMDNPKFVGLDTMNLWIANTRPALTKLVKKVDLFIVNDTEAREFSGELNFIKAAQKIRSLGPKFVVIKKGEHGVLFYSDKYQFSFSAYPVEKVADPTGAGDTFAGGLMGTLANAKKINDAVLRKAIIHATTMASFNVEGRGLTKTASLTKSQINARMRKYIKFISP